MAKGRLVVLCLLAAAGLGSASPRGARVEGVASRADFPEAVIPGAISRLCAETGEELRALFAERGAPYDPELVRSRRGRKCHVDYTPSLAGFRADPDDWPVRELFMNVDGAGFLARRAQAYGDSLDISKALIERLPPRVKMILGTQWELSDRWYEEALAFHYGDRADRIDWRHSRVASLSHPWTQDYLKSGRVGGKERILVTRRLFEGRREDGEVFRPMLDSLKQERFVRSSLSWEGGDLQFVRHPLDPEKLVLFFGDSAKAYWGAELSPEEYAYVLRREFGADFSVDLSGLAPHVDYLVAFLPAEGIALLARPTSGSRELAEAAAAVLEERFEGNPPAILVELRQRLAAPDALSGGRRRIAGILEKAKREAREGWPMVEAPGLTGRMARHVAARCPGAPQDCFAEAALEDFLQADLRLLRDWAEASLRARTESVMDVRLLSIVESQITRKPAAVRDRIEALAATLEGLGFTLLRVPWLGGDRNLEVPWSGISYTNTLLVDRTLFVPRFGLGEVEERILGDLGRALPSEYEVVPVYARHMLLSNGGVHCAVGIVRGPDPEGLAVERH
jgi:hypothetical protein